MTDSSVPDATVSGKPHYEVLDGLRGSAAVLVVLFHIMGMTVSWADSGQLLHHAALAVDFFFGLSGFVVAYAYDDRWKTMSTGQFFATRLVRLHPLVLLGAVLGLLSFTLDPFATNQKAIPMATVLVDFALACLVLPHPSLPNRWTDSHSLNSPAWSLMQEYIGNIFYALVLRRLNTWLLSLVMLIAAGFLIHMVWHSNTMDQGSDWTTIWGAPTRMGFSFTMGLWLYRIRNAFPKIRLGWVVLTGVLVAIFAVPRVPDAIAHGNGLYEAFAAIVLFPLIILLGAHSEIGKLEMALCKVAGRISYPVYILHFPFLFIYMNFINFRKPPLTTAYMAGAGAFVIVMVFAWLALKLYDEPVRKMLRPLTGRKA
ncbi:acyltransferase family protein [Asticcacaulis solisilvae]|uniref:acyltransferase family protein n=1 Tax=Asticcacaulis solisilvae TaxID=1217274 RepID=UPI003FD7D128